VERSETTQWRQNYGGMILKTWPRARKMRRAVEPRRSCGEVSRCRDKLWEKVLKQKALGSACKSFAQMTGFESPPPTAAVSIAEELILV
jgi:hypothetical protein